MSACNCPPPWTGCPSDCRRGCSACEAQACRGRIATLEAESVALRESNADRVHANAVMVKLLAVANDQVDKRDADLADLRRKLDEATAALGGVHMQVDCPNGHARKGFVCSGWVKYPGEQTLDNGFAVCADRIHAAEDYRKALGGAVTYARQLAEELACYEACCNPSDKPDTQERAIERAIAEATAYERERERGARAAEARRHNSHRGCLPCREDEALAAIFRALPPAPEKPTP
jgi:hypothetical protein